MAFCIQNQTHLLHCTRVQPTNVFINLDNLVGLPMYNAFDRRNRALFSGWKELPLIRERPRADACSLLTSLPMEHRK
jgi:hypothetical protein